MKKEPTGPLPKGSTKKVIANIKTYFSASPGLKSFKGIMKEVEQIKQQTREELKENKTQFKQFNSDKEEVDNELNIFDILENGADQYSVDKNEEKDDDHTKALHFSDLRHLYKEIQVFSDSSFTWLKNEMDSLRDNNDPFLRNMKFFITYHYFNSSVNSSDHCVFEILSSCLNNFRKEGKFEFKLTSEFFEIYAFHDNRVYEKLVERQHVEKLKKYTAFFIYKLKNNNYSFFTRMTGEGIQAIKLKSNEFGKDSDEYLIYGKQIYVVFQMLINTYLTGKLVFQILSNFQFKNSIFKSSDIIYKKSKESEVSLSMYNVLGEELKKRKLIRRQQASDRQTSLPKTRTISAKPRNG